MVRDRVQEQLKGINRKAGGVDLPKNNLQRGRSKYESLIRRIALRLSRLQLQRDPKYQRLLRQHTSTKIED